MHLGPVPVRVRRFRFAEGFQHAHPETPEAVAQVVGGAYCYAPELLVGSSCIAEPLADVVPYGAGERVPAGDQHLVLVDGPVVRLQRVPDQLCDAFRAVVVVLHSWSVSRIEGLLRVLVRCYPRACGEAEAARRRTYSLQGPSPRARGSLAAGAPRHRPTGSIPAGAGKPRSTCPTPTRTTVHPRVRGARSRSARLTPVQLGLCPPVRPSLSVLELLGERSRFPGLRIDRTARVPPDPRTVPASRCRRLMP